MYKRYSLCLLLVFGSIKIASASDMADCRVMTGGATRCNPYGNRLIRAKEVVYEQDKQKLIVTKTLPLPGKKPKIKIISVADIIEKHVKVEDSLRYKGTQDIVVETTAKKEKTVTKREENTTQKHPSEEKIVKSELPEKKSSEEKRARLEENLLEEKRRREKEAEARRKALKKAREEMRLAEEKRKQKEGFYTIQKGDTLSTIASRYGMKTKDLVAMNQLDRDAKIRIGKKLLMPFPQDIIDAIATGSYKVESDDTLISIARKFNLKLKDVAAFNHLESTVIVRVGKTIELPFPERLKAMKAKRKTKKPEKKFTRVLKKRKGSRLIHGFGKHKLRVTATAYTSHGSQTDKTPFLAAWNNRIRPGMKIIAVSRDLLSKYGLRNGSRVRIAGLSGTYRVRDKMNKRYRKRIDIYMGMNRRRALRWGRRSVILYW